MQSDGWNFADVWEWVADHFALATAQLHGGHRTTWGEMDRRAEEKSALLYACLDDSGGFYANRVEKSARSRMNVPFFLADESLNDAFLAGARETGLLQLKGHKSVGGMRASLYNAMPLAGVQALVGYMKDFARRHG